MSRIKEYPSITSFDGNNDALAIEQTDGASNNRTRKVTPAQLKQYMEAGDFVATGEVEDGHGNILAEMAKSADVDAEIGDLSQTGLTGDSVAAQLVAAVAKIANKVKLLPEQKTSYTCSSTNFEYTGVSVTCPFGHTYIVRARVKYNNAQPTGIIVSQSDTNSRDPYLRYVDEEGGACIVTFTLLTGETAYIWGRWALAPRNNDVILNIIDITN